MVEVRQVQTDADGSTCGTYRRGLRQVAVRLPPYTVNDERYHHGRHDEQVVVRHLHMVRHHLQGGKQCRHHQAPQVLAPIGQHHAGNHRRQVGQGHHLPEVAGGNDDEEVARERPYHAAQQGQVPAEVKGAQQDIEAQQVGKDVPYIVGQPQVVGLLGLLQHRRAVIRWRHLVGGHAAEQCIGPTGTLARTLFVSVHLLSGTASCRRVMAVEDAPFRIGREEIGKRHYGKQNDHQHIRQPSFQILHNYFFFLLRCKVTKIIRNFAPSNNKTL